MITFSEPGDTPQSVAARYLGKADASLADRIKQENLNSFAWQNMNASGKYAANRALWISDNDQIDEILRDEIVRGFDWIPSDKRASLAAAQKQGIDIYTMLGAHALTAKANQLTKDSSLGLTSAAFSARTLDRVNDLKLGRLERFTGGLNKVKGSIAKLVNLEAGADQTAHLQEFNTNLASLQGDFHYELNAFKLNNLPMLRKGLVAKNIVSKKGWGIYDKYVMREVEQMSSVAKYAKGGFWGFEIFDGGFETFDAYREGKDWTRVATKESGKIITASIINTATDSVIALIGLTPVGWVGLLIVGAIEAGEIIIANHYIDKIK